MAVLVGVTQTHFRLRNDDGNESSASWIQPTDIGGINVSFSAPLRVRLSALTGAGSSHSNLETVSLYYSKNGGTWTQITAASSVVRLHNSSSVADHASTTQQITSGGTFGGGNVQTTSTQSLAVIGPSGTTTEFEFAVEFISADVVDGDIVQFRMYGMTGGVFDSYAVTPSVIVDKPDTFPQTIILTGSGNSSGQVSLSWTA